MEIRAIWLVLWLAAAVAANGEEAMARGPAEVVGPVHASRSEERSSDAEYAIVDTDIEPEEARLFLDDRFIGTADDFDGHPDYLYLEPGSYVLECRLAGYVGRTLSLQAEAGDRFEIDLELAPQGDDEEDGSSEERDDQSRGRLRRTFGPRERSAAPAPAGDAPSGQARPPAASTVAFVHLVVTPANAAVYLDGAFVDLAEGLARRQQPLVLSVGPHTLEIMAPDHLPLRRELELTPDQELNLDLALSLR